MVETTNLNECKKIAENLLNIRVEEQISYIPELISHPLFETPFITNQKTGKIINILDNEDNYNIAINQLKVKIKDCNNYKKLTQLITKPYKLAFFKLTIDYICMKDFCNNLIDSWVSDEYICENVNVSKAELLNYFKMASKKLLMNEEELNYFSKLEDEITVYRGVTNYNKNNLSALSWTLDKEIAKWFCERFNENGNIYKAIISKKDIFAYCNKRKEKELILDYTKLTNVQLLKE
ncbi:MAG: hypothetical protein Q4G09_08050 [Clostridia bacterium]|nr:hypothetical protein [Clostridia bacterium]